MGKVRSREEEVLREIKYRDMFDENQTNDATQKRNQGPAPTDQLVGENNVGFQQQGNLGTTKFDDKVIPGIDFFEEDDMGAANQLLGDVIAETRAQDQTKGEKALHGVGRMLAKVGTETMKGIGYIGGAIPALIAQDIDLMTNNFWVEQFQELEDASKEAMPVYVRDEVENGSLGRQIWSPEFWATDGADGVGFLLSAILSGGATSAITNSLKIGVGVAKMVGKGAKIANKVDNMLVTGTQTFLESAAETKGMVDGLKSHYEQYKQEDGTYLVPDPTNPEGISMTLTQEEVDSRIGSAGVETLAMNALFLWGPNALQTKYLFGKGDDMADMLKGVPKGSVKEMQEGLSKVKPWKAFAVAGPKSAGAEAFQELSQFAIEKYETKKGKGLSNKNFIEGLADGYIEGLTTIEGHKSMFLGAVLGIGPGAIGGYKKRKAEKKQAGSLLELMNNSSQKFVEGLSSVYQKNEDGSIKLDENKKPLLDKKVFDLITSQGQDEITSKLYQEAKLNGDVASAKLALADMTIRNIYPYLQTAGGLELWKEHTKEISAIVDNDAIDLGFDSTKEYTEHLEKTALKAKAELRKVKDLGPAFFGINPSKLLETKIDKKAANEKLQQFIGNIEYNAVRLSTLQDNFREELRKTEKERAELEAVIPRDEEGNITHRDAMLEPHIEALNKKAEMLKDIITVQGESYNKLFNKEEQQKAFDAQVKEQEEANAETEADNIATAENRTFADEFRANLKEKGYTLIKDENGKESDFATKSVILKDDNGDVYRIDNEWNRNTKTKNYFLNNLKTGEKTPLSVEALKDLGLDKPENVITRDEFAQYQQAKRIVETNRRKLLALNKLIGTHTKSHVNLKYNKKLLVEELAKYSEELNFWNENKNFDESDVAKEIVRLKEKIEEINKQIDNLESQKTDLQSSLKALRQLKTELEAHVQNKSGMNFSFSAKIDELENKLLEGDYELDEDALNESIDVIEEWLEPLYVIKEKMQNTVNKLLDALSPENRVLFEGKDWAKMGEGRLVDRYNLLSTYTVELGKLNAVKKEIKGLQKELNSLNRNKKLLVKYERLGIEIKNLLTRNNITKNKLTKTQTEKTLSRNQDKRGPSSPVEQTSKEGIQESSAKKHTPWSTVTAVFNINKKDDDGNFELSKNWEQAARWSKAMSAISLSDLGNNQVRFVNNDQLREITGKTPPVNTVDALYAVLYQNGEVYSDENGVIYTGVAHPETYFKDNFSSIDVNRLPEYKPYRDLPVTKENPAVYNNVEYTSKVELEAQMLKDVAKSYTEWRKDIVDRLSGTNSQQTSEVELWNTFVDTGKIPQSKVSEIASKIIKGETLTDKELSMRTSYAEEIESILNHPSIQQSNDVEIVDYKGNKYSVDFLKGEITNLKTNSVLKWGVASTVGDAVFNLALSQQENNTSQQSNSSEIYSGISDISKGFARRGTEKHKPKNVLTIASLTIPDKNTITKENNVEVDAEAGMVHAVMENGQVERLKNYSIGEMETGQDAYINKIIKFMGLFNHMYNQDFKSTFAFKGKGGKPSKSKMPLVSNSGKTGILNQFINWGYYDSSDYSISVHPMFDENGKKSSELEIVINQEGVAIKIPLSSLKDKNGNYRLNGDPALTQLTDFLKTKFMNVSKKDLNNPNGMNSFWMPKGWEFQKNAKGEKLEDLPPILTYDKYDSYNDYVLENSLYSDVQEYDESTDEIPTFVNQYITFDEETTPNLPEYTQEEAPAEVKPKKKSKKARKVDSEFETDFGDFGDMAGFELEDDFGDLPSDWDSFSGSSSKGGGANTGGSTFNNAMKQSSKPTKKTPENVDPKDKTKCPMVPKGKKKTKRKL